MRPVFRVLVVGVSLLSAGCASDGSFKNPFANEADQPAVSVAPVGDGGSSAPVSSGSSSAPVATGSATSATVAGTPNIYGEFSDVPVPREMSISSDSTHVTVGGTGTKTGTQKFRGKVEVSSLMNSMRKNMSEQGWTLRSSLQSKESVMVFEKRDRMCTLVFEDGMIYTDMHVFVAPRMEGEVRASSSGKGSSSKSPSGGQKLSQ